MARGNDGNLLQHCIEAALAEALVGAPTEKLYVVLTHSMAPTEPFVQQAGPRSAYRLLEYWMDEAKYRNRPIGHRPAVVHAYRQTNTTRSSYPNSARVLAAVLGKDRLCGHMFEIETGKASALRGEGLNVAIHNESWRNIMQRVDPAEVGSPWLVSMDPNTFSEGSLEENDFSISREDLAKIAKLTERLLRTGHRGAVAIFCYSMRPATSAAFVAAVAEEFEKRASGCVYSMFETTARGGNKHVCALITNAPDAAEHARAAWSALESARQ